MFNLAGATLGAGALSLPYAVAISGLGFAVAQLVLAAVLTVYTIRLLIRAEDITKCESDALYFLVGEWNLCLRTYVCCGLTVTD